MVMTRFTDFSCDHSDLPGPLRISGGWMKIRGVFES